MVTLIEAVGYWAIAWGSHTALPLANMVDRHNERFAHRVDAGHSCFDRVGGTEGEYGKPENYTLDLACNYRLVKTTEEGTVTRWQLIRSE